MFGAKEQKAPWVEPSLYHNVNKWHKCLPPESHTAERFTEYCCAGKRRLEVLEGARRRRRRRRGGGGARARRGAGVRRSLSAATLALLLLPASHPPASLTPQHRLLLCQGMPVFVTCVRGRLSIASQLACSLIISIKACLGYLRVQFSTWKCILSANLYSCLPLPIGNLQLSSDVSMLGIWHYLICDLLVIRPCQLVCIWFWFRFLVSSNLWLSSYRMLYV